MKTRDWIRILEGSDKGLLERFKEIYGAEPELIEERRQAYLKLVREFAKIYGEGGEIVIARAPGRANLMGRHIDHRGGYVNPIALNLEVIIAAEKRQDDQVIIHNTEPEKFKPSRFQISEEMPEDKIRDLEDWDKWTFEKFKERQSRGIEKGSDNYVKGAVVYFQELFRNLDGHYKKKFSGMNLMVTGNIPISGGLSSSSALFVAVSEAIVKINNLEIPPMEFVEHCGWGEWYVGTRGGSGDHAAIKLSKRGYISHIGFFPFSVDYVPFPSDYRVVICDSGEEAHKAGWARSYFNQRVASYEIALMLIKETFPHYSDKIEHLRDINTENLGVDLVEIYRIIKSLPERISREEVRKRLPAKYHLKLDEIFAKHQEPEEGYKIRQICLYGLAECERSRICFQLLRNEDITGFGKLMRISHDGDRVARFNEKGRKILWDTSAKDKYIDELIKDLQSGLPERQNRAQLYLQPGGYECSTERIDQMVDIALKVEGVIGAQLCGAGLGGSIMVMAKKEKIDELVRTMIEKYYQSHNLSPAINISLPVEGSGVVEVA